MSDFPFQFRACRANQDIKLLTTNDPPALLQLIKFLNLEDKLAEDIQRILLDDPEKKTTIISLHSYPEKGANYAYTALLECDLCGVRKGFFALFKSRSGDTETLTEECRLMYEFINGELEKESSLAALDPNLDHYSKT